MVNWSESIVKPITTLASKLDGLIFDNVPNNKNNFIFVRSNGYTNMVCISVAC